MKRICLLLTKYEHLKSSAVRYLAPKIGVMPSTAATGSDEIHITSRSKSKIPLITMDVKLWIKI